MDRLRTAPNSPYATSPDMESDPPAGSHGAPSMEVAHVLFMDIIGYSKLRMNQQAAAQIELQNLVNSSSEVIQAKAERKFICRPTGDGMALLFFRDLVSPVRTALQIHGLMDQRAVAMRAAIGSDIKLRMGIHSGTILMVEDLNAQSDAAGDGINIAQRVMDCGDADHILLSSKVAESLLHSDPWQNYLTDLGEVRVKHGVKVHLYRLRGRLDGGYYGNPGMPKKVEEDQKHRQEEINKYRGTFFERNPAAKKQIAVALGALVVLGVPTWQWKSNPKFRQSVQSTWAGVMKVGKSGKETAKSGKSGSTVKSGGAKSAGVKHSSGGGSDSGYASEGHKIVVPDMVGRTLDDATQAGAEVGLRVLKSDKSSYNSQYGEGIVYAQSPAVGSSVAETTKLYVRISKGDPPDANAAADAAAASKEADPDE